MNVSLPLKHSADQHTLQRGIHVEKYTQVWRRAVRSVDKAGHCGNRTLSTCVLKKPLGEARPPTDEEHQVLILVFIRAVKRMRDARNCEWVCLAWDIADRRKDNIGGVDLASNSFSVVVSDALFKPGCEFPIDKLCYLKTHPCLL